MANRIRLLSENVANQIAAGEVVERPASVVKELVENSLDSGATQIDVRTRGGGRSLIEVIDNGSGMSRDDALMSLERHATSKLRETEDLRHLLSYGFRGEALPSIASVSRFTLRTREPSEVSGTEIIIQGGKISSVHDAGLAPGTHIEVRSLFYNLPARRKFLRTEQTELSHVSHQMILAGFSRPDVGFHILHDDANPTRWTGGQDLPRRIAAIMGEPWLEAMIPLEGEQDDLRVTGFIGQPGVSRSNRQEQFVFVNRRPVDSRTIHYALQEGYHNSLMKGRYPVTVLFLEINPEAVDVNIHPAKREIRFHDEGRVRHFLVQAIQTSLREFQAAPISIGSTAPSRPETVRPRQIEFPKLPSVTRSVDSVQLSPSLFQATASSGAVSTSSGSSVVPLKAVRDDSTRSEEKISSAPREELELRFLGVIARLYIITESREGLVLIDQHAAHERIMFEQVLARLARQEVTSQRLLLPVTVKLPPREADFLHDQLDSLQKIGLEITSFGGCSFLVDGLPPMVRVQDIDGFVRDLVVELQSEGGETRKQRRLSEETVAKKACRLAVKANDALNAQECESLLRDLLRCELPYTCPHGRPTMILFSKAELEKKFGRLG